MRWCTLMHVDLRLAEVVSRALIDHGTVPEDVNVSLEGNRLQCVICINGNASMLAIMDSMVKLMREKGDVHGIHGTFAAAGAIENADHEIVACWPIARVREEVALVFPRCIIAESECEQILAAIKDSQKVYFEAWGNAAYHEPDVAPLLLQIPCMALFSGKLLPTQEGRRSCLLNDRLLQAATCLSEVMDDAAVAHFQLKEILAPGCPWASTVFTDVVEVPLDADTRTWRSSSRSIAPCGIHFDPSLRGDREVYKMAKNIQRPEQVEPPVWEILDISRLSITFESMKDLTGAVARILDKLDCVWVRNRFRNPTCLGHREISIGVSQYIRRRNHVSELRLQLRSIEAISRSTGNVGINSIQRVLSRKGVARLDMERVLGIILRMFDVNRWDDCKSREHAFVDVVEYAKNSIKTLTETQRPLAEGLIAEYAEQAKAVGVPEDWVQEMVATVSRLSPERI